MKKLFTVTAISIAVMLAALPIAYSQATAVPPPQAQAEKVFEGQLTKVDAAGKWISVKGAGDAEMKFAYTEQTQVLGPEKDVQGLTGKTGAHLKVTYRSAGDNHTATKIEMIEQK